LPRDIVVWPSYIDAEKSRRRGRRIAKKKAVPSPKLKEIDDAAKSLGLSPKREEDKAYPREWWQRGGRVLLSKGSYKTKADILEGVAKAIARKRSAQGT
jgi:signal recognition particle subunit SRP19